MFAQILKTLIPILWGAAENRLWKEHGENFILNHFKLYHIFTFLLFGTINAIGLTFSTASFIEWLFFMTFDPLMLDVVWWLIRYYDFKKDYGKAVLSYGEPNAWHSKTDWDNWLKLPLIFGIYWWWYVFTTICIILGAVLLI
jgi:hypothetical protein